MMKEKEWLRRYFLIIKENEYQGLQEFDVLIEDSTPNSDYFQVTKNI